MKNNNLMFKCLKEGIFIKMFRKNKSYSHVFVYMSGSNCRHCIDFTSSYWKNTLAMINKEFPHIKVLNFEFPSKSPEYPIQFHKLSIGLPGFFLIKNKYWEEALSNPDFDLVKNMKLMNFIEQNGKYISSDEYKFIHAISIPTYNRSILDDFKSWIVAASDSLEIVEKLPEKVEIPVEKKSSNDDKIPVPKKKDYCTVKIISRKK